MFASPRVRADCDIATNCTDCMDLELTNNTCVWCLQSDICISYDNPLSPECLDMCPQVVDNDNKKLSKNEILGLVLGILGGMGLIVMIFVCMIMIFTVVI